MISETMVNPANDNDKKQKLKKKIAELEQKLQQDFPSLNDADVVKLNDRGVFEMNFESVRVQLRFLRQLERALDQDSPRAHQL